MRVDTCDPFKIGEPSTKTTWQPTLSLEELRACCTASSKASLFLKNPLGLRVLLVCRKRLSAARGRLAQLVRARALQARGRRFEPCTAHQFGFGASPGT